MNRLTPVFLTAVFLILLSSCSAPRAETPFERQERLGRIEGTALLEDCQVTQCTELLLGRASIEDYTVLNDMPHVTRLSIGGFDFESLTDISGMTQLTELRLSAPRMTNLDGLEVFVNLTDLTVEHSQHTVSDYLGGMTELRRLTLRHMGDIHLDFARDHPQIERLVLDGGDVIDLSLLAGHPTIAFLDVRRATLPDDISALEDMPSLQELRVGTDFDEQMGDRDESALWELLRSRGVRVDIFPGVFTPEIVEPPISADPVE